MAVSRADRRIARTGRARELFGDDAKVALDLLELTELAWHDCYGEVTPPEAVVEDIWTVSHGDLRKLVAAALLAVQDWRDLQVAAGRG
jgi:hypothetical protein